MIERYRDVVIIYPQGIAGEIKEAIDEMIDMQETYVPNQKLCSILVEKNAEVCSFKLFSAH